MANRFLRFPILGGDDNVWGEYLLAQISANIGVNTGRLINDGGTLKYTTGKIGIDNGMNKGICEIDTEITIDISGVSNSIWGKIEVSVSATAITFSASDILGATDPSEAPTEFKDAYDGKKGAFYLDFTKRCIGLIWKDSSGDLLAVINTIGYQKIWWASDIGGNIQRAPGIGFEININTWNMDTTISVFINHNLGIFYKNIRNIKITIKDDNDLQRYDLYFYQNAADPTLLSGGLTNISSTQFGLSKRVGGQFDGNVNFDGTDNRGYINFNIHDF